MNKQKQRFVIISDVHGFYDKMMDALNKVNFDPETDFLISCGDEWDRGKQPLEVMKFFDSLENKAIIRGNHTQLFEDLCLRQYPEWYDSSNGTLDTVKILGDYKLDKEFDLCCERAYNKTRKFRNSMVNFFETKNYVFVHSFIPLRKTPVGTLLNDDWRFATQKEWNDAMWNNPYKLAEEGYLPEKTLIFGHFHTSYPRYKYHGEHEWGPLANFGIYYGDGYIAIDACTAYSGQVNVLVLEDDFISDKNNV